jgi:hypothetical protein
VSGATGDGIWDTGTLIRTVEKDHYHLCPLMPPDLLKTAQDKSMCAWKRA